MVYPGNAAVSQAAGLVGSMLHACAHYAVHLDIESLGKASASYVIDATLDRGTWPILSCGSQRTFPDGCCSVCGGLAAQWTGPIAA